MRALLDKITVRLFHPHYCRICGCKLAESMQPTRYDRTTGAIKAFAVNLTCQMYGHDWYGYIEKAPRGFQITKAEWDAD